jgi:16S rRNA (uracil1498-N3)-methyltransferase
MVVGGGAARMIALLPRDEGSVGRRGRLLEGESHHLRVRRAREGDTVELRDGFGLVGRGRLVRAGEEWEVEIDTLDRHPAPPPLVLVVGAGDRERFAWVVEKAVELGVTAVIPLETERTAGVATRIRARQVERLGQQALEAVKQSGNSWACVVEAPAALDDVLALPAGGTLWLADPAGPPPPATLDALPCRILVGPEGGFTAGERAAALAAEYHPVSLGPHVLRFETAAIAAAAAAQAARERSRHV